VRHIPNIICLFRIALVWPVLASLEAGEYGATLAFFVAAAVSDGIDGYLAKRFHWQSELGKFLDPFADKLLLVSVFIAAAWFGLVPWWLTAAAVARDVMIGLGALIFRLWFGPLRGRPTIISKVNTFLQLGYLVGVIMHGAIGWPWQWSLNVLAVFTLASTVLSGADYLFAFTRRAWNLPPSQSATAG
jgi:cardiolipin synthase (CMP-forming)